MAVHPVTADSAARRDFEPSELCGSVPSCFALPIGVREDPVCGSVNAGIAQWLIDSRQAPPPYEASQGAAIGRDGNLSIRFIDGNVWVGGASLTCIHGTVQL